MGSISPPTPFQAILSSSEETLTFCSSFRSNLKYTRNILKEPKGGTKQREKEVAKTPTSPHLQPNQNKKKPIKVEGPATIRVLAQDYKLLKKKGSLHPMSSNKLILKNNYISFPPNSSKKAKRTDIQIFFHFLPTKEPC